MAQDKVSQDKVLGFLDDKWKPPGKCPICGKANWLVSNTVFEVREYQKGGLRIGVDAVTAPVIMATCGNCGYTLFFNALVAGVVEQPQKKGGGHG